MRAVPQSSRVPPLFPTVRLWKTGNKSENSILVGRALFLPPYPLPPPPNTIGLPVKTYGIKMSGRSGERCTWHVHVGESSQMKLAPALALRAELGADLLEAPFISQTIQHPIFVFCIPHI